MSERWIHQIKSGLTWAITALVILTVMDYKNNTWERFLLRLVVFVLVGVFVLGYFSWKKKAPPNKQ
jgi:multisubunit Na+/H+ antiporter MnhB subunit